MKLLLISSVLALAVYANGFSVKEDLSDKDMFLRIIECAQKAVINGISEIGLPSHDPLRISKNFSEEFELLNHTFELALENMIMEGIPWWNVTQMDDITKEAGNPVFDYTIYWAKMTFEGKWRVAITKTASDEKLLDVGGDFGFELDHLTFSGLFNFTKPSDDKEGGFNELTLHLHTKDSDVHLDGLGVLSTLIKAILGPVLADIVNLDPLSDVLGPGIRDKLNRDWIKKPERIEALISHCGDSIF